MARTERESDRRDVRSGRRGGAAETSKERAKASAEILEHTGPAEKKG